MGSGKGKKTVDAAAFLGEGGGWGRGGGGERTDMLVRLKCQFVQIFKFPFYALFGRK